jgi:hypothetical protein
MRQFLPTCELISEGTVVSSPGSIKYPDVPSAIRNSKTPSSAFTTRPTATFAGEEVELLFDDFVLSQPEANKATSIENRRRLCFFIRPLADQFFGEASR